MKHILKLKYRNLELENHLNITEYIERSDFDVLMSSGSYPSFVQGSHYCATYDCIMHRSIYKQKIRSNFFPRIKNIIITKYLTSKENISNVHV